MAEVIVVGAGLAGLVTAYRLLQRGVDVELVESAPIAGGHVQTVTRDGWRYERGPNWFPGSADPVFALADELGLTTVAAHAAAAKRYLFLDGSLKKLPQTPGEAVVSPLLPPSAKMRLLAEPLTFAKARDDESVRDFFESRFGANVVDRFVAPLISGTYGSDVSQLGVAAAFPELYAMAKKHGSLIRTAYAVARQNDSRTRKGIFSLADGLGGLTQTLASHLEDRTFLNEQVLVRRSRGEWLVGKRRARSLVLATPAWAAARLVHGELPTLAAELATIDYAPLVSVHLLYKRSAIARPLDGIGFFIPRNEGPRTLSVLWPSALFDVCDPNHAVLTCFIGGALDRGAAGVDSDKLVAIARRDLRRMMGIDAAPEDFSVVKNERAIPQYSTRHLAWRARVMDIVARHAGLHVTGNWLQGVSMADTVTHAQKTANEVLATSSASNR